MSLLLLSGTPAFSLSSRTFLSPAIKSQFTLRSITMFNRPKGFKATAVKAGIKKNGNHDFVMIASDTPCNVAAMFTTNKVCAAPVNVCKEILSKANNTGVQCVVINSGCANAVTGEEGLKNARNMSTMAAKSINVKTDALVMSTGVIGVQLDMSKIEKGVNEASKSLEESDDAWHLASKGIMTTDLFPKITSARFGKSPISIAGIAKGAGMIHPNMATMLSVLCTDAKISVHCLDRALKYCVERSFNSVTVDGDTSTNDTVAIFANGQAGNPEIKDHDSAEYKEFQEELLKASIFLAKELVRDGEGATKLVTIHIKGASSAIEAKTVANSIAQSNLVKTAIFGQDANWGRVLAAVGYSGANVVPEKISLWFAKTQEQVEKGENSREVLPLLKNGTPLKFDEAQALELMKNNEFAIVVDLGQGQSTSTMWTCDLGHEYINVNASYRS